MATMTALATVTVGVGGAASITFNSISSLYTDLLIKSSLRENSGNEYYLVSFNSSTSNFSSRYVEGDGTSVGSSTLARFAGRVNASTSTANTFSNTDFYVPNYTSSNFKSYSVDSVNENNATSAQKTLIAGLWADTSAITSISFSLPAGNFVQYSTATLYGIWKGPEVLPSTPTIGVATVIDNTSVSVPFTPTSAANVDVNFTALSSPGSITATGTSSPITVTGLTDGTPYTFQVRANNPGGSSAYSAASNSVTPETPGAFESIATVNVSSSTSTISFSSIPQTYKHLQLRITGRGENASNQQEMAMTYNGNTSGVYSRHLMYGDGSSVGADARGGTDTAFFMSWIAGGAATANAQGICIVDILDYTSGKTKTTSVLTGLDRNGGGLVGIESSNFESNTAISSISISTQPSGGTFAQYSSFALYGIKG
jgi:hypothetical protein